MGIRAADVYGYCRMKESEPEIECERFVSAGAVADAVGRHRSTVQWAISQGKLSPDGILLQRNRRPVAVFAESRLESIKQLMALKRGGEAVL